MATENQKPAVAADIYIFITIKDLHIYLCFYLIKQQTTKW